MPSISAHVAHVVAAHCPRVFGVMGNGNAYVLDALVRAVPDAFVAVRHEAGGVVAADTHYRCSGVMTAATATYGPGFTNTLTPLAEAVQARTPLLLVVGDAPTTGPRPWDVDQTGAAAALGARTFVVGRDDAAAVTHQAITHAVVERTAVVLAIPYDLGAVEAGPLGEVAALDVPAPVAPDDTAVAEVARLLDGAERPLLLAGRGAWLAGAGPALGELAEATGALTATSALGRSIFPDARHDLGVSGGFGGAEAMELVRTADVVVVLGASLNQFTMRFGELFGPDARVVQVDLADGPTHPRVDVYLRGDAALTAAAITTRLDRTGPAWRDQVTRPAPTGEDVPERADDGRLHPARLADALAELLPEDRVVVSDGGHFIGWANAHWPVASPERMVMVGTAFQSIGFGFASVPGAVTARPEATVVLTTGDGGGLMALADLETAVRTAGGRGLAVVWNDAAYGAEVTLYGARGLDQGPMLIPETDFAALARAVGAEGVVVRSLADLEVLARWRDQDPDQRPFLLLDCRICGTVVAPYQQEIVAVNRRMFPATGPEPTPGTPAPTA